MQCILSFDISHIPSVFKFFVFIVSNINSDINNIAPIHNIVLVSFDMLSMFIFVRYILYWLDNVILPKEYIIFSQ